MKTMTWLSAVVLFAVACKKGDEKKAEPPAKMVEKQKVETPAAPADVTVTSKSPEAIKHFEQGRELVDNARGGEAGEHFKKATELDPEFAQAHAYLGLVTNGPEGVEHLAKAATLADKLPAAEKELITAFNAQRAGDTAKALAAFQKTIELAPGAWRVDVMLANIANGATDTKEAIKRLEHALSIKPDLTIAHNGLAYAYAGQREWEKAIASAKKQVELAPKQPNPRDTLGEVLLWSGKYEEAEKEFAAAVEMEPKFTLAWQGVGLARAYRGDYKGAHEAFDKRKATSTTPFDKADATIDTAWIAFAENKLPAALAKLDEADKDPAIKGSPVHAFVAIDRGHILAQAGKHADAAKAYTNAWTRIEALKGDGRNAAVRGHRVGTLRLAAYTGKPLADADKLIAAAEEDAKAAGATPIAQSAVAHAKGLAAWAKKDVKGAIAELSKCVPEMPICRYDLAVAQRKSGDKAAADATDKQIKETPRRDPSVVYLVSHLGT